MIAFISICLLLLSANGVTVPGGCWAIFWAYAALKCIASALSEK